MKTTPSFAHLSDQDLRIEVERLAASERGATAALIASLEELDRRRLYLPDGYSSMFVYCTRKLLLGEGAAYRRIEAARTYRRFPAILARINDGALTLTAVGLIAPHLTAENHVALLDEIAHMSKADVAKVVARLHPLPDVPSVVRKLPAPRVPARTGVAAAVAATPARPPVPLQSPAHRPIVAPLAPERFRLQVTMSEETHDTLRDLQNLMRHSVPGGDAGEIIARALKLLRDHLLRRKTAQLQRPSRRPDADVFSSAGA